MRKRYQGYFLLGLFLSCNAEHEPVNEKTKRITGAGIVDLGGRLMSDVGADLRNLLSWNTFAVGCVTLPLYIGARPADHKVHSAFYDATTHTNIHQPPTVLSKFIIDTPAFIIPVVVLRDILSSDPYHIRRAEVFSVGLLLTWGTKNLLKIAHIEGNKRPPNGNFPNQCHYGGHPSGHNALLGYITSFWFAEKGKIVGIPLCGLTALSMLMAVMTNRHYLSQVIFGVGYGVMFGLAAHTTFEKSVFSDNTKIGLVADPSKGIGLKLSYEF